MRTNMVDSVTETAPRALRSRYPKAILCLPRLAVRDRLYLVRVQSDVQGASKRCTHSREE